MTSPSRRVAILSAVRTPTGKYGGTLRTTAATALGTLAVRAALERGHVAPGQVPMVFMGHCIQAGTGQNPARQVLRGAGIPDASGAATVNMVCGSGLQAIFAATNAIRAGEFEVVVAGGMESMSSAPYLVPGLSRWGLRIGNYELDDAMQRDALLDAYGEHEAMGLTGERIAREKSISRAEADAFAARSHQRAAAAIAHGDFRAESVDVPAPLTWGAKGLTADEGPRGESTPESLARLKPSFDPHGILTAGNSSQLSDGASAVVLASEEEVRRRNATPLAWVHSGQVGGVAPDHVMEAPIPTVRAHLDRVGLSPGQFDRIEHNEAFASASIAVQRAFGFADDRFNVHGGAIALGHPIGSSGCRIVVSLVHELVRTSGKLGLATLCMGGGNGLSLEVDRRDL